jgi:hypothetical protein
MQSIRSRRGEFLLRRSTMAAPPSITTLDLTATWVLVRAPHFLLITDIVLIPDNIYRTRI